MRFNIVRNEIKQKKLQEDLKSKHPADISARGRLVSYEMPTLQDPFPKLRNAIFESDHREGFHDIGYYIETKNGYLASYIPAPEYYKLAFRAIADKLYALSLSIGRIKELEVEIQKRYFATHRTLARTNQPSFSVNEQVYTLKSEIASVLFVSRSILDSVATILHFLYGPTKSLQFNSFTDFVKFINKEERSPGETSDETMKQYIAANMEWFFLLRDLRDYITHYSSIDISFYEDQSSLLLIFVQNRFEINALINSIAVGLESFIKFFDEHFAGRIGSNIGRGWPLVPIKAA